MELDPVDLQLVLGMAGAAVEVRAVRAQAARQVDRKEAVNFKYRAKYPVLFNFK